MEIILNKWSEINQLILLILLNRILQANRWIQMLLKKLMFKFKIIILI